MLRNLFLHILLLLLGMSSFYSLFGEILIFKVSAQLKPPSQDYKGVPDTSPHSQDYMGVPYVQSTSCAHLYHSTYVKFKSFNKKEIISSRLWDVTGRNYYFHFYTYRSSMSVFFLSNLINVNKEVLVKKYKDNIFKK